MSETRAGGLELDKLDLNVGHAVLDIRPLFTSFNFYEDIFSNYVTATLTLDDSMNLPTNEQIVGHEEFHIKFKGNDPYGAPGTNADWIDLKFKYVYPGIPAYFVFPLLLLSGLYPNCFSKRFCN